MPTIMSRDINNTPLPVLRLKESGAHSINVTETSARNSSGFSSETRVVSLYATGPVYIKFGEAAVTATTSDHYFPAGIYYDVSIGGGNSGHYTHIAALRADIDCKLYVSEKE
jgi:hypothetical protein